MDKSARADWEATVSEQMFGIGEKVDGSISTFPLSDLDVMTRLREAEEAAWARLMDDDDFKVSKAEANYRPGSDDTRCSLCTMFLPPDGCTSVEGGIRAEDLCDFFERKE